MPEDCFTRRLLQERYTADFKVYIEAMHQLDELVGMEAFREAMERADHARLTFERSRDLLDQHVSEHGCG